MTKLLIDKKELQNALNDLKKVSVKPSAKMALLNDYLKVEVKNNNIELTYSDSQLSVVKRVDGTINEAGSFLLPLKKVDAVLKKVKSNKIELSFDHKVELKAGVHSFKYDAPPTSSYPRLPEIKEPGFYIDTDVFKKLFDPVLYAGSKAGSRPILTAVHTLVSPGGISAVTTDSFRLASNAIKIDTASDYSVNIPGSLLSKVLKMDLGTGFHFINNGIDTVLSGADTTIHIRNMEGNYPNTARLIPDTFNSTLIVNKKQLLESLELAALSIEGEKNNVVFLDNGKIEAGQKNTFSSNPGASFTGENIRIAFQPNYLIDALKNIDAETVELKLISTLRPFIVKGENDDVIHLVTPIRTR